MKFNWKFCGVLVFICLLIVGCGKDKNKETNTVNLYYNSSTVKSINYVVELIKKYEEKEGKKINLVPVNSEEEIEKKIGDEKEAALVLLDGYSFIDFNNKNYLRDITYLFKEKETREKFANINNLYGIYEGKYYGLGITPFTLELVYNEELLRSKGIKFEDNNYIEALKKLNEKKIKIPTYVKSEYTKEILFSALVANDTIAYDLHKVDDVNSVEDKIKHIKNGQKIFDTLHELYTKNIIKEDMFQDEGESAIKNFNEGKIPVLLTTTLTSEKITDKRGIGTINKMPINNKSVNSTVGMDCIICSSSGKAKIDDLDNFFRYIINSDGFEELTKKNCITGNRKADSNLKGVQIKMVNSIVSADDINMFYFNIISNENIRKIDKECKNVLNGKYDGKEWSRIVGK